MSKKVFKLKKVEVVWLDENGRRTMTGSFTVKSLTENPIILGTSDSSIRKEVKSYIRKNDNEMYRAVLKPNTERIVKVSTNHGIFYL
tara:strand:- start:22115 stop:22375 length:261 start_codon:yes stop_codon:yes gene_type:complete